MDAWVIWLIAGVAAAVGEMFTLSFFLAPFAVGAFLAMAADLAGLGDALQFGAFAGGTAVSFALLRPVARRHLRQPPQIRTGTDALIGRTGTVVEAIAHDSGTVKVEGEVWTARPYDPDETYATGTRVQVVQIRGATALVSE